jgi:3(or 17)beta-hydroxysteroid dehydrogenase
MGQRLAGKVALVTGAAQGIGAGIATAFAAEGATLFVADVQADPVTALAETLGATPLVQDVAAEADWAYAAAAIGTVHGRVDILVHNAGIELVKPLAETTLEEWRRVSAVNLDSIFIGCKAMLPLLIADGRAGATASVVNISSIAGLVGYPDQAAYNTSKAGVRHITKSLAIEWAAHGHPIRVNSIHPGCIRTPMLELAVEGWVREGSIPADDPWAAIAALCPLNSVGRPEDIAMGAVYLASDESRFVTGSELVIDGGWVAR